MGEAKDKNSREELSAEFSREFERLDDQQAELLRGVMAEVLMKPFFASIPASACETPGPGS